MENEEIWYLDRNFWFCVFFNTLRKEHELKVKGNGCESQKGWKNDRMMRWGCSIFMWEKLASNEMEQEIIKISQDFFFNRLSGIKLSFSFLNEKVCDLVKSSCFS